MSTLENTELEEKAYEIFEEAACEDSDFRALLAETFLEGMKYYLFCKEDASHYLDDNLESWFGYIFDADEEGTLSDPIQATKDYVAIEEQMAEARRDYNNKTPEYLAWKARMSKEKKND